MLGPEETGIHKKAKSEHTTLKQVKETQAFTFY